MNKEKILTPTEFILMKELLNDDNIEAKRIIGNYTTRSAMYNALEKLRARKLLLRISVNKYHITNKGREELKRTVEYYSLPEEIMSSL